MPGSPEGSANNPVSLDPFQTIVGVGWNTGPRFGQWDTFTGGAGEHVLPQVGGFTDIPFGALAAAATSSGGVTTPSPGLVEIPSVAGGMAGASASILTFPLDGIGSPPFAVTLQVQVTVNGITYVGAPVTSLLLFGVPISASVSSDEFAIDDGALVSAQYRLISTPSDAEFYIFNFGVGATMGANIVP